MPTQSLRVSSRRKIRRKRSMRVRRAVKSSGFHIENGGAGVPGNEDRPRARRKRASSRARAAAVDVGVFEWNDACSTASDVADDGMGRGIWVARNMW